MSLARQILSGTNVNGSVRIFNSLKSYKDFYDNYDIEDINIPQGSGTYRELYGSVVSGVEGRIRGARAVQWYGAAHPTTIDELYNRTQYPLMDEYRDVYERIIKPRIDEILKDSKASLEVPTLRYNDIGLGIFDFAKASLGLQPLYKYYSLKHKEYVEFSEVEVKKNKDVFQNVLKSDGSPVVIVPDLKEGYDKSVLHKAFTDIHNGENVFSVLKKYDLKIGKFTSSIKKTYLYKENVPKPLNAVRIFIFGWVNSGKTAEQYKWSGYAGIGIAELLSTLGVNVSIHVLFGPWNWSINLGNGRFGEGIRLSCIQVKSFSQTLDSKNLLYVASDASFFRGRIFIDTVKQAQYYNDYMSGGLGSQAALEPVKELTYKSFGSLDKMWNKNGTHNINSGMLYYFLGDITNEQEMSQAILEIGLNVVNENRVAREQIGLSPQP